MESSFEQLIPFFRRNENINVHSILGEEGEIHASAIFAGHADMMTFLMSYSDDYAKQNGLMHALIDNWLNNDSEGYKKLDFEGGNIESLARFYSGFGAEPEVFLFLEQHKFPLNLFFS